MIETTLLRQSVGEGNCTGGVLNFNGVSYWMRGGPEDNHTFQVISNSQREVTMDYEVIGLIWHTKDGQYYGEGAIVKLDHLPEKTVAYLVQTGTVKPVESKPKAARVAKKKEEE